MGESSFYAVAAQAMRRILVDHARSRGYAKRGGGALKVSFDEAVIGAQERRAELIDLWRAYCELTWRAWRAIVAIHSGRF